MNLTTGRVITRHHFTEVPITEEVIKRVHELADRDQQTEGVSVVHGDGTGVGVDDESINFDTDESDKDDNYPEDDSSEDGDVLDYLNNDQYVSDTEEPTHAEPVEITGVDSPVYEDGEGVVGADTQEQIDSTPNQQDQGAVNTK